MRRERIIGRHLIFCLQALHCEGSPSRDLDQSWDPSGSPDFWPQVLGVLALAVQYPGPPDPAITGPAKKDSLEEVPRVREI